jgi:hypothetical protein
MLKGKMKMLAHFGGDIFKCHSLKDRVVHGYIIY